MRILGSTQHSAAAEEDIRTKSPSLTISTIASPDHQPSQASVVTALLPPVPPLTSSPVMSMLSKAHKNNSNNPTKQQSMFSDLGSSDTKSGIESFSDGQPPSVIDYTGFLNTSQVESKNMLDYSQYLKDSNIDLEKTNLEDLNGKKGTLSLSYKISGIKFFFFLFSFLCVQWTRKQLTMRLII